MAGAPIVPELDKALAAARVHRAAVVVAKVDRLTRSVAFLSRLLEAGVEVRFADLPVIDGPTGRFMLQQMASVAELEAGLISTRTKAALAAAKARGTKLGGNRGAKPQRAAGRAFLERRARARAKDLAPALAEIVSDGAKSLREIAQALNERGIPTARGRSWTATQVARVLLTPHPPGSQIVRLERAYGWTSPLRDTQLRKVGTKCYRHSQDDGVGCACKE